MDTYDGKYTKRRRRRRQKGANGHKRTFWSRSQVTVVLLRCVLQPRVQPLELLRPSRRLDLQLDVCDHDIQTLHPGRNGNGRIPDASASVSHSSSRRRRRSGRPGHGGDARDGEELLPQHRDGAGLRVGMHAAHVYLRDGDSYRGKHRSYKTAQISEDSGNFGNFRKPQ
eukprot:gene12456-biopygen4940